MALDQAANFVRGTVDASISAGDTTISVTDASVFPDPSNGNYNLILWDGATYTRPGDDPDVEIVRVTGRDTGNDNLTVARGEESTADAAHPDTSILQLGWTAKMRDDVQSEAGVVAIDDSDSPYTTGDEAVILSDTSSAGVTVTLSTADVSNDAPITVVNISGSNAVTVNTEGGETIDPGGASSKSWSTEGWAVTFTPDGSNWDSNLDADFESVTTTTATINSGTGIGIPSTSSAGPTSMDTWHQASSSRPAFIQGYLVSETDGTTPGRIRIEVDESGGTTADYFPHYQTADEGLGSGGISRAGFSVLLPAGAQYQFLNQDDPNDNNNVADNQVFTL